MYYTTISEYDISSQKRDAERALGEIAEALREIDSVRSRVESQMRELNSAQSSLDRAIEEKVRDVQRNAGKSSGYSSFGYSSSDGRIKDAQRTMERAASGISDGLSKLSSIKSKVESADRQARSAIDKLTRTCEQLRRQLSEVTKEVKSTGKKSDDLARELEEAKRKKARADAAAADLSRELDATKRKSTLAGMAAAAAAASAGGSDQRLDEAEREISKLRRELAAANRGTDKDVLQLRKVLKMRDDEIELLSMMLEAARSGSKSKSDATPKPRTDQRADSEEYAELWNDVMEDGVIELDEVRKIKTWLANHDGNEPEFSEMDAWCNTILDNGAVSPCDVQTLYDCSLRLLKSMGAKVDED